VARHDSSIGPLARAMGTLIEAASPALVADQLVIDVGVELVSTQRAPTRPCPYRTNLAIAPTTSICSASVSPWKIGSASAAAAAASATGKSFMS
jgi:hypothetical protein